MKKDEPYLTGLLTPGQLRGLPFPKCYKKCRSPILFDNIEDCGNFCPEKFTKFNENSKKDQK